jgi:pyridoxamine 5'-phosphate oxidase
MSRPINSNDSAEPLPENDPIRRFRALFAQVLEAGLEEPTAMTLATADARGRPSARLMLLKDVDERGFVFYTNLESRKSEELDANPHAALCFFWQPLALQVRVEGTVEPVSPEEADAYFASRPHGSQIGAWASQQSQQLPDRRELEERIAAVEERFDGKPVDRPPHWSGYRLIPERVEFWQGRPSRLHERQFFERDASAPDGWRSGYLYP